MHEEFDETILVPPRRHPPLPSGIDEDTIVPHKQQVHAVAPDPAPPPPSAEAAHAEAANREVVRSESVRSEAAASAKTTTKRRMSKPGPPALIEPAPARQRRVPLTHKRVQDTLRVPDAAHEPSVLSRAQPARSAAVYGFRMGDRAPISLDVPALVGRKPTAPRIPGKIFPRLVRVSSPLSEVSGTHVELRQEGTSVIVTDLRSTNGTVVRMPGSRPVKLRQGDSLVVRPGTLVDIGDGNVLEILPPPRLSVTGNTAGEGIWS